MKRLNIGCGLDIKEGFVNLDSKKLPGVDGVRDIEQVLFHLRKKNSTTS